MLTLLSPAKTIDWTPTREGVPVSRPLFRKEFAELVERCKTLDVATLQSLMKLSQPLAELNHERFQEMTTSFTKHNSRPCVLAFKGDVYRGLDAASLTTEDLRWAQDRLRIISGLYGLLRPLDLMQPYRLEMGTPLETRRGKTLYAFWGDRIAAALNAEHEKRPVKAILNLASSEYIKAVPAKSLAVPLISVDFKEYRSGELKTIAFSAKRARGFMARFVVEQRIEDPAELEAFDAHGYAFDPDLSTDQRLLFSREQPASRSS